MRVTYCVSSAATVGGTERSVFSQAAELVRRGHEVDVVGVLSGGGPSAFADASGVAHRDLLTSGPGGLGLTRGEMARLAARASRWVPSGIEAACTAATDLAWDIFASECSSDVIVTTTPPLLAYAVSSRVQGAAIVHQEHRVTQLRSAATKRLLRTYLPEADMALLLTEPTLQWVRERIPGVCRTELLPNGIALPAVVSTEGRAPVVLAAGRLVRSKQFVLLVEAFAAAVADDLPQWRLRIVGEGPERDLIEARAQELGVRDRVDLPGWSDGMEQEWRAASIYALSSAVEAYSMVLLEAAGYGVPVVSFDCPTGPREIVVDDVTGLLVPTGDVAALGVALRRLMTDDPARSRMADAALAHSVAFDIRVVANRLEELLLELCRPSLSLPA